MEGRLTLDPLVVVEGRVTVEGRETLDPLVVVEGRVTVEGRLTLLPVLYTPFGFGRLTVGLLGRFVVVGRYTLFGFGRLTVGLLGRFVVEGRVTVEGRLTLLPVLYLLAGSGRGVVTAGRVDVDGRTAGIGRVEVDGRGAEGRFTVVEF